MRPLHLVLACVLLGALLIIAVIFAVHGNTPNTDDMTNSGIPHVTIASVGDLTSGNTSFTVVGTVQSETEANVLTESSGQVTHVYKQLGDYVSAGAIIAELENASQRAAVLQAQGGVAAAQANLDKVSGGARTEQRTILEAAAASAKSAAVNALLSAYSSNDDAVHHTADVMFSNPDTNAPHFNVTVTDSQLSINAESERAAITSTLARESGMADSLNTSLSSVAIHTEIAQMETEIRTSRDFFDTLINALNKAVATQGISASDIATYKANAAAARTSLTGTLSALASADAALTSADENLAQGVTGGQPEDVDAAKAALTQAQGGLEASDAALEKTIVRAPISGTINALPLNAGDFVSSFSAAATIANNHALEIVTHVTEQDALRIKVADPVSVNGTIKGTVTRIAPAIDPTTKSIEVKIGITDTAAAPSLINGSTVTISFTQVHQSAPTNTQHTTITIPIVAAKITPNGPIVFSVTASSTLVAHPVTFGPVLSDRVTILSGISQSDVIVTDARGLFAGESVVVGSNSTPTN